MLPPNKNIASLSSYVLHLEEQIATYRKVGKDTTSLRHRRTLTLRRLNELQQAPTDMKKAEITP